FLGIIRRASNADNQTQKTYVSHTRIKTPDPAKDLFVRTLIDYAKRITEFANALPDGGRAHVLADVEVRNLLEEWGHRHLPAVDLIVTSPPYLKSVDYVYNQMAEYFWIGD